MKTVGIIIAILVLLGGCCVGGGFTLFYLFEQQAQTAITPQVEGTAAVERFIGKVETVKLDVNQTVQQAQSGDDGRLAMSISGDKGTGLLLIKPSEEGTLAKLEWAILEFDGNSYVVLGTPPETLDAITLSGSGTPAPPADESGVKPAEPVGDESGSTGEAEPATTPAAG